MNIRKITSMTMLVSFVLLLVNSVILYVVPEGRVAYWADWHMGGLTKTMPIIAAVAISELAIM